MPKDKDAIVICEESIAPGEHKVVTLRTPKLYDWTPLSIPVHVFHGKKPGPTLCVTAAIHGDEINGIEIIRRLIKKPALKRLAGTLIAIPVVNIYGFLHQDRYLMDRRDLNRSFPGSSKGSLASRLAHLITTEILSKATHIIDLHTGSLHRSNLPQIRVNIDSKETESLAEVFNAPIILHSASREGSMRAYANDKNIPLLLYEAGESLRFDELSIRTGLNGILRVMCALNMIVMKKSLDRKLIPTIARSSYWIRAPYSGILRPRKGLGKRVEKGELIAKIGNPTTTEEHELTSSISGIIIGKNNLPMIYAGAALFHIACFETLKQVAKQVEYLQETYSEDLDFYDL